MKTQVTLTRTDEGATTKVKWDHGEASKSYASWEDALSDARQLGLIDAVESTGAKILPPGFPLHANVEIAATSVKLK
jgi:hypothetical protein